MANLTIVDNLYGEFEQISAVLTGSREVSLQLTAQDHLRKSLLMAAASYFEFRLTTDVLDFVRAQANGNSLVTSLVKCKAVTRQYHSWFDWDVKNTNKFLKMFGDGFAQYMAWRVDNDQVLESAVKSFMALGSARNNLAHQDYANFPLEWTLAEVYEQYVEASRFIDAVKPALEEYALAEAEWLAGAP